MQWTSSFKCLIDLWDMILQTVIPDGQPVQPTESFTLYNVVESMFYPNRALIQSSMSFVSCIILTCMFLSIWITDTSNPVQATWWQIDYNKL